MRNKPFVLPLLLCICLWTSCSDEADPSFTLSTNTDIEICADEGATTSFSFSSTREWTSIIDSDWIEMSQSSGDAGTFTIRLTCTDSNYTGETRTATITLASVGLLQYVYVVQDPMLTLVEEEISLTVEGKDELDIYFNVNMSDINDLGIYYGPQWLINANSSSSRSVATRSMTGYYVSITVPENTGSASREGYFLFYHGDYDTGTLLGQVTLVQEGTGTATSTDFSADGNVTVLQEHTAGNGLPLVLMGDGFLDTDIADGTYSEVMEKAMENLFSEEPMTSLQDYFDVYQVDAVSENNVFGSGYSTAFSCEMEGGNSTYISGSSTAVKTYVNYIDGIDITQALTVVILNSNSYAGTTWFGYYFNGEISEFAIAYCPIIYSLENEYFREVLVHEAVGHGLAKLADEYSYTAYGTIPDDEITEHQWYQSNEGWYMNVDFTSDTETVLWADFLSDETYDGEGLGVYEGACAYIKGAYRSTEDSMMNANNCGFNAPSRQEIYYRVMTDGAGITPTHENFVNFDVSIGTAGKAPTYYQAASTRADKPRFHAPQFTGIDLGDTE